MDKQNEDKDDMKKGNPIFGSLKFVKDTVRDGFNVLKDKPSDKKEKMKKSD